MAFLAEGIDGELLELEESFLDHHQLGTDERGVGVADGFLDFDEPGHDFGACMGTFPDRVDGKYMVPGWGGGGCDKAHRGGGWLVRAVQ